MALGGIGGNGAGAGSALDRFQKLRDAAQRKLESADRQTGLAELIQRKQKQLGAGGASPGQSGTPAERILPGPGAQAGTAGISGMAAPSAAYGPAGAARKQDAAPRLGRYVDFMA